MREFEESLHRRAEEEKKQAQVQMRLEEMLKQDEELQDKEMENNLSVMKRKAAALREALSKKRTKAEPRKSEVEDGPGKPSVEDGVLDLGPGDWRSKHV